MKKRIAIIATAVLIAAACTVGGTLAFFTDKGEVNNVITMGNVSITLTEPLFQDSTDNTYTVDGVTPGQRIVKDPTVTNVGEHDAYIRCRVSVADVSPEFEKNLNDAQKDQIMNGLNINTNDWVKYGDYYYYQQKLAKKPATGESKVLLFSEVNIPKEWNKSVSGCSFKINITAEAIQEENFTPTKDGLGKIIAWNYSDGTAVSAVPADAVSNPR